MKKKAYLILLMASAIAGNAMGQTLSVQSIETDANAPTELVVTAENMSAMTALQFNLTLPEGVTLNESAIEKWIAHSLEVRPLSNGDRFFVLFNMGNALLKDGELLRLPLTAGAAAGTFSGRLSAIRAASITDGEAVSHAVADAAFSVTVKEAATVLMGDVNGDEVINVTDVTGIIAYILGKPVEGFRIEAADINGDGLVNVADVMCIIEIILNK